MGSPETRQLARDSLLGLAVGDALGAGSEGHSMLPTPIRDLTPPRGVVLRWTDDTQAAPVSLSAARIGPGSGEAGSGDNRRVP